MKKLLVSLALAGALIVPAALVLPGCPIDDLTCTLMGCGDTYDITISQEDAVPLDEGRYIITVRFGGDDVDGALECDFATAIYDCDVLEGDEVGGWLDDDGLLHVYINPLDGADPPPLVTVTVETDDLELVGEESFQPDYDTYHPNGTECAPECYEATDEMIVEMP